MLEPRGLAGELTMLDMTDDTPIRVHTDAIVWSTDDWVARRFRGPVVVHAPIGAQSARCPGDVREHHGRRLVGLDAPAVVLASPRTGRCGLTST